MRYLIVETNWDMMGVAHAIADTGTFVTRTDRPEDIADYLHAEGIDLILVDQALSVAGGPVLSVLRRMAGDIPVVVAARKPDTKTIAALLQAGADSVLDYSMKHSEMAARLGAVARRALGHSAPVVRLGGLTINLDRRRAKMGDVSLHLSPKIYAILEYISLRAGNLVTREALLSHVYGLEDEPAARVFDVYMCTLRSHLTTCPGDVSIQTVRGKGFRFVVHQPSTEPAEAA